MTLLQTPQLWFLIIIVFLPEKSFLTNGQVASDQAYTCSSTAKVVSEQFPAKDSTADHDLKNIVLSPAKVISSPHSAVQGLAEPQILTDLSDMQFEDQESPVLDKKHIPDHIWENRNQCTDYQNCVAQTGTLFGFVPLTPLQTYQGPTIEWNSIPDVIQAHKIVRQTDLPNFMAARVPVRGQLNVENWKKFLSNYWDKKLIDLLTFGFLLDFDRSRPLNTTVGNHKLAQQFPEYLDTEISHGAILSPFKGLAFKIHTSPLMTRPKHDSCKHRTILDLSWPKGASVNAGVTPDVYLGTYFKLTYPSIDHITQKLKE